MNTAAVALLTALAWSPMFVDAQTTYSVATCSDLAVLSSITTDAVIDFTASPISCDSNTNTRIAGGITVELTSSLQELSLVNVRFVLVTGSSLVVSVPIVQWQSQETMEGRIGAALYVTWGCTATFKEDVTFTGCSIVEDAFGEKGGAVSNKGDLAFMGDVAFIGTTAGGGLYNSGTVTFSGDALFEDNYNVNNYNDGGGGLNTDNGNIVFKGAASFIGNEVVEVVDYAIEGKLYYGGSGGGLYADDPGHGTNVTFEGPVLFSGNKAKTGAGLYTSGAGSYSSGKVVFQDLVTFEDNVASSVGDASGGGAMATYQGTLEFQAGVIATGNVAKNGGAFYLMSSESVVNIQGPVAMTENEAHYQGGAIWNAGNMTTPQDADISGNTAIFCPGIKNFEYLEIDYPSYASSGGSVAFSGGGSTYSGGSIDLCYLGEDRGSGPAFAATIDTAAATCGTLLGDGNMLGDYSVFTLDTMVISEVNFEVGSSDFFDMSCANQTVVYVTGGGNVTVTSSTEAFAFTNIRFEIGGYTNLYFNVPELTMTGIRNSTIGGSMHVDKGSSLEFLWDVKFLGNTLAYQTDGAWNEYGGAAMFNAGHVNFRGQAYFSYNGQHEKDGLYSSNSPGGAIFNVGDIEFEGKTKFWYNFNLGGGNGGGIANSGHIRFNKRTVWRRNTVEYTDAEEGTAISGGHGAALYNFGPVATTDFLSKALFMDNIGGFRGGAVAANGEGGHSSLTAANTNKITFEGETTFKDNGLDIEFQDTGGAGLWVYKNATVEFQDRVVFRRNLAINGGAIMNGGGFIKFASTDLMNMIDNNATESCPDIKNYDKGSYYHNKLFGDINDPSGVCGCTWYEGSVTIGSTDPVVGETSGICEF